jgi:DNA topoisomerase-1
MPAGSKLVIVESPTKANTIKKFLGGEYQVLASMGHVRDLPANAAEVPAEVKGKPWARLGVDVENGFAPVYVIPPGKKKVVSDLRRALKEASEVYLATDEDREGEAIGWHLVELLQPKVPVRRMVFHEITRDAIRAALESPRQLNEDLVQAQEARRILDRLVGYTVSPLLWKKVAPRLSAGRVQSAAVRLLVMRERERMVFRSASYWDIKAQLRRDATDFEATLTAVDSTRLATGKDFDERTGKLAATSVLLLDQQQAEALARGIDGRDFRVAGVEKRQQSRSPYPPFTTSTLQQEANRKLGLSANRTMRIAQRLYESGHITYMRTDSVNLSEEAITGIRALVSGKYGTDHLSPQPRRYKTKSKGAQEAHEAIRPAGTQMATADQLGLEGEQAKLYTLIWMRTVASQMADAQLAFTTARLTVRTGEGRELEFRASGREVLFPGFFRAYVEGSDDPDAALDDRSQPLPSLSEGQEVACTAVEPLGHETKPPARYTEASLVKALEAHGIGRPSTYATIIDTIQRRGYVIAKNKQLVPTFVSMAVTQLLERTLEQIVDLEFTAAMEESLDAIAEGKDARRFLSEFYQQQLVQRVENALNVDAREVCTIQQDGSHSIRVGRYGPFIEVPTGQDGQTQTVALPADVGPSDANESFVTRLVELARKGAEPLGRDPRTDEPVYILVGPYGPYVQLGATGNPKDKEAKKPKRISIPAGMDPAQVEFETALALLQLPRKIGVHPETGKPIKAGIGRYGAYVVHENVYASLKAEDSVLTIELPRALELLADKKPRRRASEPLKELGNHPESGTPINVLNGPYGPFIRYEKLSVSIPEHIPVDDITLDEALVLIDAKLEAKGMKKSTGGGTDETPAARRKGKASKAASDAASAKASGGKGKAASKSAGKTAKASKAAAKSTGKTGASKSSAKKSSAAKTPKPGGGDRKKSASAK